MLVAVTPSGAGGRLRPLADDGTPAGDEQHVQDLAGAVKRVESRDRPRWLWASTAEIYPRLHRAGVRVERCHDLELAEALLLGAEGAWGQPRTLAAASARLAGRPVPPDPPARAAEPPGLSQDSLFDAFDDAATVPLEELAAVYRAQRRRVTALPELESAHALAPRAGGMRTLIAVESAGALVAVEMGRAGLPWRADVHDALLRERLGPPSPVGGPPAHLAELGARLNEALGQRVHPDSPAELLRAFARVGIMLRSTRKWELEHVDHPAVPILLEYKELYRLWTAHGWTWLDQWVTDGRFRAEYIPGGVVSGRWATRGGGALQIPKVVRRAVVADPGWTLVVADAGQLEPRVLAAVSGDRRLARAAAEGDLYAALAAEAFDGDRTKAKIALLGAMYGATSGMAAPALAALRRFYPAAWDLVEEAARTGESGGLVRTWLGRTCPPSSVTWREGYDEPGAEADFRGGAKGRARGRFTRNFVIQGTAAEWALVLLARLRTTLAGHAAELVFFQHDEVIVHCPRAESDAVADAINSAADEARTLLFGDTEVRFPLDVSIVERYSDAK
ncbi:bifunctional 3'-5' exonuclease/DNA polymerase [Dactylosporangium vinaceum]|uniref:DNA-directed DNA polymerase n=1 Tax=Dactylosporangium vinaceum TaxID=53362 RepID=A0ABV5MBQ1_9ACTN|nr:bifunctional 3'-5' exonuclease/DNA polymerase [Dactylosporangium vinaceum]UAB98502.1 bifunctional 3'-5' exonuclease/DNA polymerase [Dactylosporangium vinaceum]